MRVDFVLRSFLTFEIIGVVVFFLFIQVAVILYQLTQPFFDLCPRKNKVGVCRRAVLFNRNAFPIVPSVSLRTVWEIMRAATCAVLFFEKINIAFAVLILLKLTVDTVFTILKAASS